MPPFPVALRGVLGAINTVMFVETGFMAFCCFMYGKMAPNTAERDWIVKLGLLLSDVALYTLVVG
jgi:hypothetical protein